MASVSLPFLATACKVKGLTLAAFEAAINSGVDGALDRERVRGRDRVVKGAEGGIGEASSVSCSSSTSSPSSSNDVSSKVSPLAVAE